MSAVPEIPRSIREVDERAARDLAALERISPLREVDARTDGVELIECASLKPEPIRWLWPGWLARGKLHVLAGAPGTGKTTLAMDFAACVSAARALPSGWRPQRGNVLIWSGEDDPSDTLVPRLIGAGADLTRIRFVGDVRQGGEHYPFDPARDVDKLAAAIADMGSLALLVIDPLVSAVSGDSHKNAEVRRGLAPLVDLANRMDAALLGITHYSKGTQGREPLERVSGSLAFGALARIVMGTVRQQTEDGSPPAMLMARAKSNIGPDGGGFAYAFEQVELAGHPGLTASRIAWGGPVEGAARDLLAEPEPSAEREAPAREEAESFLLELLRAAPLRTDAIKAEAKEAGFSWATVRRAKDTLGVKATRKGYGEEGGWFWNLPLEARAKGAHPFPNTNNVSTFEQDERLWENTGEKRDIKADGSTKEFKDAHHLSVNTFEHLCPACDGEGCHHCSLSTVSGGDA